MGKLLYVLMLGALASPAYSQLLSFGVKAGAQITDSYSISNNCCATAIPYDRHYIIGPTAEVRLPFHLSFEADALYRRSGFTAISTGDSTNGTEATRFTVNDWQIPFLVKWAPGEHVFRPFIDAGVTYRHVSQTGFTEGIASGVSLFATSLPATPLNANSPGATVGAGLAFKAGFLRISPEIRYTHWTALAFRDQNLAATQPNQVDFLVGFTF
jgi:hypothetical protein